jgi:hypothetical protein
MLRMSFYIEGSCILESRVPVGVKNKDRFRIHIAKRVALDPDAATNGCPRKGRS